MTLALEAKKLKRTGYFPAFLAGGLLASAFPLVNMLVRAETFTALPGEPFSILMDANWQMMAMTIAAYFISAVIASALQDYNFVLEPLYVCRVAFSLYAGAVPMAAVFWMIANLIQTPVFSVGIGLASIVPSVLMINTKIWFAYPMSYPFYLLMIEYGRSAAGVYERQIAWLPWLPAAVLITVIALGIACMRFGAAERR